MKRIYWQITSWVLFICWVTGAGLFMAKVQGGFFTNYLSDITFPPWYYIYLRGLLLNELKTHRMTKLRTWFAATPERAFISIFIVGVVAEVKTYYFPGGIISGTFDPVDILCYGLGILPFYILDKISIKTG